MQTSPPRLIFAGTPEFAAVHLKALIDKGFIPLAVYTQPDREAGRGHKTTKSAVKIVAQEHGLRVIQPVDFKDPAVVEEFKSFRADLAVVTAYGIILPSAILNAPRLGCINVHASLLPKYRGAAPIQRAILDGEKETGISIIRLVEKLDAGDILKKASISIDREDTSKTLFAKLALLGAQTLTDTLPQILEDKLTPEVQDESQVSYAAKITKEEALLDFSRPAPALALKVRSFYPWPVAVICHKGVNYKILKAEATDNKGPLGTVLSSKRGLEIAAKEGALLITVIQAPGKGPVNAADLLRSKKDLFKPGELVT